MGSRGRDEFSKREYHVRGPHRTDADVVAEEDRLGDRMWAFANGATEKTKVKKLLEAVRQNQRFRGAKNGGRLIGNDLQEPFSCEAFATSHSKYLPFNILIHLNEKYDHRSRFIINPPANAHYTYPGLPSLLAYPKCYIGTLHIKIPAHDTPSYKAPLKSYSAIVAPSSISPDH